MVELAVTLGYPVAAVRALDDRDLATLVDVLGERNG